MNNKPIEILELEKFYNIKIVEIKNFLFNILPYRNYYTVNKANEVIGLALVYEGITSFEKIGLFPKLKYLDLGHNNIKKIEGLDNLTDLEYLNLESNEIQEISGLDKLVNLVFLGIMNNALKKIEGLTKLIKLEELQLDSNEISRIEGVNNLVRLEKIDLSDNNIEKIEGLNQLTKLVDIELPFNSIRKIDGLENLVLLKNIDLSNNNISKIEGLDTLDKLEILDLSYNNISKIENIENQKNLKALSLSNNSIRELKELLHLKKLTRLSLKGNQIEDIEECKVFLSLDLLEVLNIEKNPFVENSGLILKENENQLNSVYNAVLKYEKKRRMKRKIRKILPIKIMLLGNTLAGKSTFLEYLKNDKNMGEVQSTHILEISKIDLKRNNKTYSINFFDFGGQDYYHGIYQAFFTLDTIDMLFWHEKSDKISEVKGIPNSFNFDRAYWLGQIYYSNSLKRTNKGVKTHEPLLIIQTHADEDNQHNWTGQRGDFHQEFYLSLSRNQILKSLKFASALNYLKETLFELIIKNAKVIEITSDEKTLFELIEMAKRGENYHSTKLDELLNAYTFGKQALQGELEQLSRRGSVLYYNSSKDLEEVVWLNPTAVIQKVHSIFQKVQVGRNQEGILKTDFEELFKEDPLLLEMLKNEKVIFYDQSAVKPKYIIPSYLPLASEDETHDWLTLGHSVPNICLKFETFIPFGLINQLICYYGQNPEKKKFWRDQLIFTYTDNEGRKFRVWIKLDFPNLEILISIFPLEYKESNIQLSLQKLSRAILDDIIKMYWGETPAIPDPISNIGIVDKDKDEIEGTDIISSNYKKEDGIKRVSIDDLYLSLDNEWFVHLKSLDETKVDYNKIVAYPVMDCDGIRKLNKQNATIKSLSQYRYLTTNKDLSVMKKIFISYSKSDEKYLQEFVKNLINLKDEGKVEVYYDTLTDLGDEVHKVIQQKLLECDIMFALVSIDYLNTSYIRNFEIKTANDLGKKIVPIIIKPCEWEKSKLGKYYATLKGNIISLNKEKFQNLEIEEISDIERQAWWTLLVKEIRQKLFPEKKD